MRVPYRFLMKKIRDTLKENQLLKQAGDPYRNSFGRKEDAPEEADEDVKKFKRETTEGVEDA